MRAARLRNDARDACAQGQWKKCTDELDDARKLDPAGETRPEVQELRKEIRDAQPSPERFPDDPHDKPHPR
jgi:hypothetical protein